MDETMEDIDDRKEESSEGEEYDENADEDFNPEQAHDNEQQSSSSEDEDDEPSKESTKRQPKKSKKRKSEGQPEADALNADLDSGDEATIQERKRKKRKKETTTAQGGDEDSGGEGGFIRTRAQRVAEKEERKHRKRARDGEVTVDVDQIWRDLSSAPIGRAAAVPGPPPPEEAMEIDDLEGNKENTQTKSTPADDGNDLITIKRKIEYAGEITEVEEQVPRSSKAGQKYLAENPQSNGQNNTAGTITKPLKKPSIFEPNPLGNVKGVAPEKLRRHAPTKTEGLMSQKLAEARKNAQKMSTVQKSQLDWKGFVEEEGIRDELDEYGKSKKGFLAREAFLDRAAGAREQAARDARSRL